MRLPAAFSTAVSPILTGPIQRAQWLGARPAAVYLITDRGAVLAVVSHDALRLPLALVVSRTAAEMPLTRLVPGPEERNGAPLTVGAGRVEWTGPAGVVTIAGVRQWAPGRVLPGRPRHDAVRALRDAIAACDIGVDRDLVSALARAGDAPQQHKAVAALLGRGPGLTPSGDDVLAGFLLGARAFGHDVAGVVAAVTELAPGATSALSAQLLAHAVRGECVPEFAIELDALCGRSAPLDATARLLAVGSTSGAALAAGLVSAAGRVRTPLAVAGTL